MVKQFKSYEQQVLLLQSRGMDVGDHDWAIDQLKRVNYYRLSGYWYPFRRIVGTSRADDFYSGTSLKDVVDLYMFDSNLRAATFAVLGPIEITLRALIGHALGEVDECAHLEPAVLGTRARGSDYLKWLGKYERELASSREDFVEHHRKKYGGTLPVWVAVEILDWGSLTRLFGFAPRNVQDAVASEFGLTAPQLESWMKSLTTVRNVCAHHGRLFNRVFAIRPKLPAPGRYSELDAAAPYNRTFGHLTLIQFMLRAQGLGRTHMLPAVLRSFPSVRAVPLGHTGAPSTWAEQSLWSA